MPSETDVGRQQRTAAGTLPEREDAAGAETGPLLTRANLLRMRGRWDEAAEVCTQVLRTEPRNATAHSLLGDIYLDQGRPDDARAWYQLALELNPASEADRAKLTRADEMLEARRQRAEWEAVIEGRTQPVATSLLVRESLQRIGALAGAALCGIVLVMATMVSITERPLVDPDSAGTPSIRIVTPPSSVVDTPEERRLLERVHAVGPSEPIQAARVELDPRYDAAHLRLYFPAAAWARAGDNPRETLLLQTYHRARALAEAAPELQTIHVYVVGPTNGGAAAANELLLLASADGGDLRAGGNTLPPAELRQIFERGAPPVWGGGL
ncbi:MAG: tetratricopeptide repeat protein [Armatimonadota bacterium]